VIRDSAAFHDLDLQHASASSLVYEITAQFMEDFQIVGDIVDVETMARTARDSKDVT
jgi:hypothetical protein